MAKNLFEKKTVPSTDISTIPGLERLARLVAAQKAIESLIDTEDRIVKAEAIKRFIETGKKDSFDAIDGSAKGNIQLRKRQARSKLSGAEVDMLRSNGVTVEQVISQQESFSVNPKYANDKKLLKTVNKLLGKDVPEDFFVYQPEVSHYATSETSIGEALTSASAEGLIQIVGTVAIRTSYEDTQGAIAEAIERLM